MNDITQLCKEYEPQWFDKTADYLDADNDGIFLHQSGFGRTDLCDWENLDNFIDALKSLKSQKNSHKKKLLMDFMRVKRSK